MLLCTCRLLIATIGHEPTPGAFGTTVRVEPPPPFSIGAAATSRTMHSYRASSHAGCPCTTFTRLRWRRAVGLPGPVRSRQHIYGLPGNSRAQQAEADRGTLLACNTLRILDAVVQGEAVDGRGSPSPSRTPRRPPVRRLHLLPPGSGQVDQPERHRICRLQHVCVCRPGQR